MPKSRRRARTPRGRLADAAIISGDPTPSRRRGRRTTSGRARAFGEPTDQRAAPTPNAHQIEMDQISRSPIPTVSRLGGSALAGSQTCGADGLRSPARRPDSVGGDERRSDVGGLDGKRGRRGLFTPQRGPATICASPKVGLGIHAAARQRYLSKRNEQPKREGGGQPGFAPALASFGRFDIRHSLKTALDVGAP